MSPAITVSDFCQLVVARISVGVEAAVKISEELFWNVTRPRLVVIIDHNLPVGMLSRAVHPHILLAFGRYVLFFQNFDVCLVTVQHIFFQHFGFQSCDELAEIILAAPDDPFCHRCSRKCISKPFPVLFLTIKRYRVNIFLVYHPSNC